MTLTYYYEEEETTKLIATATEKKNRKGKEEESLSKIIKNDSNTSLSSVLLNNKEQQQQQQRQQQHVNKTTTTTTDNPFESVSHAIQENVIPFFQQQKQQQSHKYEHVSVEEENEIIDETNTISEVNKESLSLQEEEEEQQHDVLEPSSLVTKEKNNNNRIIAAIVGGIIGGTAGFFLAGPVGLLVGAEYGGQTAGIVSLLLKSSVSFGVVVASVSAGSVTGERVIQQQHNIYHKRQRQRIITIGNNNSKTLMLVRPNIDIDPIWDDLCAKAIREAPSSSKGKKKNKSRRQKKHQNNDLDILTTNECELSTKDKVFLLVSRSLNDRYSLPGYVYRCLIQDYYDRCINEEIHEEKNNIVAKEKKAQSSSLSHKHQSNNKLASVLEEALLLTQEDNNTSLETLSSLPSSSLPSPPSFSSSTTLLAQQHQEEEEEEQQQHYENTTTRPRRRVHDVHGIIKHVTATLLQVRPELTSSSSSASCSTITELTATAVEGLVFGKVYDSVMDEIINETRDIDVCLTRKILQYETQRIISYDEKEKEASSTTTSTSIDQSCIFPNISQLALNALNMLPSTHSPVDKLQYCVQFLEILSNHCSQNVQKQQEEEGTSSSSSSTTTSNIMNTDSLLTMVCEHIIVAKVPHLNAEITFLEEFARDEQLLRGKEGYALVTMQAGVTYCTDLYNDIIFNSNSNNNNGVRHDQ